MADWAESFLSYYIHSGKSGKGSCECVFLCTLLINLSCINFVHVKMVSTFPFVHVNTFF